MGSLKGQLLFNTNPFACDGQHRTAEWFNKTGKTLFLRSLTVTTGLIYGQTADMQVIVVRTSDDSWLSLTGWDRYANPNAPISTVYNFAPDWWEIIPDERLWISYFAVGFEVKKGVVTMRPDYTGHFVINATWTVGIS